VACGSTGDRGISWLAPTGDLILTIASDRATQWPVVTGTVTGPYLGPARASRGQLTFAFTLDSSFVFQLLHDFEHLLSDSNMP
jgi:hypothetical protein